MAYTSHLSGGNFSIEIEKDNTKEVLAELEERIKDALVMCGEQAVRNAVIEIQRNPKRVDTGLLKNSITYALAGEEAAQRSYAADHSKNGDLNYGHYSGITPSRPDTIYIGTNVEYAVYVHEGTMRMIPNRFLRNALDNHANDYYSLIKQMLEY